MRFLFLTQYFAPETGASQVRLDAVTRALHDLGHEVEVVTAMPNYPEGRIADAYRRKLYLTETDRGRTIRRVWLYAAMGTGVRRLANYASFAAMSFPALVRAKKPDVLVIESPPLTTAVSGIVAGLLRRVPTVLNIADLWPDSAVDLGILSPGRVVTLLQVLERWSYRKATCITAVTMGVREALIERKSVDPSRIAFLPNGVDTALFAPHAATRTSAAKPFEFVVIHPGTLALAHGLETAIEAMAVIATVRNDIGLVFIGTGSDHPRIAALAEAKKLTNVQFVAPMSPEDLAPHVARADLGLICVRDLPVMRGARPAKTFPLLAAGLPVVFSGEGEGADLVRESEAGVVTAPGDATALAEAIMRLADDPAGRAALGLNGRRYAERNYSWTSLVATWLEQLTPMLAPR